MRSKAQTAAVSIVAGVLVAVACAPAEVAGRAATLVLPLCAFEVTAEPAIALLPDGRYVVTVSGATRLQVRDSLCTLALALGRPGEGPGEYRFAAQAIVDSAGGFDVVDPILQRISRYDSAGVYVGARSVTGAPSLMSLVLLPDGGALWTTPLESSEDSVALMRRRTAAGWDGDEIARLLTPARVLVPLGDVAINTPPEYAAFDAWGPLGGGAVWIARGSDNRLEVVGGPETAAGPPVPFARIRTVSSDRDRWRGLPAPERFRVPARPLASVKGPFQDVVRAPDGEYWFWLNQPAGHTTELYACRTLTSGELLRITVPNAHKVVALGPAHVYLYGEDQDGTPTLSLHARPRCS